MNYPPAGFSPNPAEESPLETFRMSGAMHELNNFDDGNSGRRSHLHLLPGMKADSNLRYLRSPHWDPQDRAALAFRSLDTQQDRVISITSPLTLDRQVAKIECPTPESDPWDLPDRSDDLSLLLADPESLPFRDLSNIARHRVTIVAPHPDDETLGCGGAISLLCRKGYNVRVLVISDGTGSHPNSHKYPPHALESIRVRETQTAMGMLGVNRSAITFLGLKDGSIPTLTSANFTTAKALCQNYLRSARPDTIFLPWRFDPHADHRATWQLMKAAMLGLGLTPQTIEYPIWDWDRQQQQPAPHLDRISGWRLDIGATLDRKLQAIGAYRSQLGLLIDDDPTGFCLTPELLTNFTRPWEVYFEEIL